MRRITTTLGTVLLLFLLAVPDGVAQGTSLTPDAPDDEIGNRIPLILVHGWKSGPQTWDSFAGRFNSDPDLQRYFKIYRFSYDAGFTDTYVWRVFDLGGSLRTDLQDYYEWRDSVGWSGKPIVILAHSLGGVVSRSFMQRHWFYDGPQGGEMVARLITLATPHHGTPVADSQGDPYWLQLSGIAWDRYDGYVPDGFSPINSGLRCVNNYENLGRLNTNSCPTASEFSRRGFYDKIIAYGSTASFVELSADLMFTRSVSLLSSNYPNNDGLIPIQSAMFDDWPILARRRTDDHCNHHDIVQVPTDKCRIDGVPIFDRIKQDLIEAIPCSDPYEPNDSPASAYGPIVASTTIAGRLCRGADDDWFRIDVPSAGTIKVSLSVPTGADYDLEVYNGTTLLAGSYKGPELAEQISRTVSSGGTYLIRVFKHASGSYNLVDPYQLTYTFTPAVATTAPAPLLLAPGQSSAGTSVDTRSPLFRWQSVGGADSYRIEVSDASSVVLTDVIPAPATSWTPPTPLSDNHAYRWRMQTHNAQGWGVYGALFYFSTYTGTAAQDFSVQADPASGAAAQGMSASFSIRTATVAGAAQSVSLAAGTVPSGVTVQIVPPTVTSGDTATLTVAVSSAAAVGTFSIAVAGTGSSGITRSAAAGFTVNPAVASGDPAVCFDRTSVGFSDQTVGTLSPVQTVAVRNCGNGPLHISSYGASTDFIVGTGSFAAPLDLPAGGQTTLQVGFAPQTAGSRTGTIRVFSNAAGSPAVLPLYGNALAAPVTTGTINVQATMNGDPFTGSFAFSVTGPNGTLNYGTLPLTLTERPAGSYSIALLQPAPGGGALTSITPSGAQTVSAGGSTTFTMNFTGANDFGFTSPGATYTGTTTLLNASPGGNVSAALRLSYMRGGNQTISVSVIGVPGGVTAAVGSQPVSLALGSNVDRILSIAVGSTTPPGVYRMRIEAANQDGVVHALGATLVVPRSVLVSLASVTSTGTQGNDLSLYPAISADGNAIAFYSLATNLASNDTNNAGDSFVRDVSGGTTDSISVADDGSPGNAWGTMPAISDDGRYLAFRSTSTNLVGGTQTAIGNIYVRDRAMSRTARVSLSAAGEPANGECLSPSISADGRFVAFTSNATNLVTGVTAVNQVYVRDTVRNETILISKTSTGEPADQAAYESVISADGRFIAFISAATNLVSGATAAGQQLFVADRVTGTVELVSSAPDGPANNSVMFFGGLGSDRGSSLSPDGRFVAFVSYATNLVANLDDRNYIEDVFLRDRKSGTTSLISIASDGSQLGGTFPSVSADGRYVAFTGRDPYMNAVIHVRDQMSGRTEAFETQTGALATATGESTQFLALSSGGRTLAFSSNASNLVTGDSNSKQDVFSMTLPADGPYAQTLQATPATVAGGAAATVTVTLSAPAPAGGATVQLTSSDPTVRVPATVVVPGGATSAAFEVATLPAPTEVRATVVASFGGGSPWTMLIVQKAKPGRIDATAGSGQTVNVSSALPVALQAVVLDTAGHPISNATVEFGAPASGPSGTFAAGGTTAVVTTDTSGSAVAPQFFVNNQAGPIIITASTAGVASRAMYSITIAPPRGDANGDGAVTAADIFYLINQLFANVSEPAGAADANGDGQVTVADVFYLINYLFAGGPPPP